MTSLRERTIWIFACVASACAGLVVTAYAPARSRRDARQTEHRHHLCRRHGLWRSGHPESRLEKFPRRISIAWRGKECVLPMPHSSAALCSPSRYALADGLLPLAAAERHRAAVWAAGIRIRPTSPCPQMLKADGYRTACIGKWHLGWDWDSDQESGRAAPDPKTGYRAPMPSIGRSRFPAVRLPAGSITTSATTCRIFRPTPGSKTTASCVRRPSRWQPQGDAGRGQLGHVGGADAQGLGFLRRRPEADRRERWIGSASRRGKEGPFFLYVPLNSPHTPIVPIEEFRGNSQAGGYGDWVAQTDDNVGRILQALEDNGLAENTLVIFSSDNGPEALAYNRDPQIRSPQRRPAARREARSLGGGTSCAVDRPLARAREAGAVNDGTGQPGRRDGHAGCRGRREPAGRLRAPTATTCCRCGRKARPARATRSFTIRVNGDYAVRHDGWLLVDRKIGRRRQAARMV